MLLVLLACYGCSRQEVEAGHNATTLSIGMAAPEGSLDPQLRVPAVLLSLEPLLTISTDGRATPNLAERWERSSDGVAWRFDLRKGMTFHDSTPVTADRVVESLSSAVRQPGTLALAPSFQQVSSIVADSPTSFTIRLNRPSALLLSDLSYVNITHGPQDRAAGTGPFIVEISDGKRIVMRRFDGYRDGTPAIDRLELNAFPTVRNAWTALMRGEIDFLYEVGPDAAEFVDGESSVQTFTFLKPYSLTLGFNLRHPVLRSREVRQAINRAINRGAIVQGGFRGRGQPGDGPIWPGHWAFSRAVPTYEYNREAAVLGFAAAGHGRLKPTAGRMPSRLRFNCLVFTPLERVG
ncbi:MAG: ABC transporter substrate-binding protein, partial [Vicinamibacterales bacterium]